MAAQLVAIPAVERLSPACIRILGGNPGKFTLQGTNTYLLGTGRRRILIDTGEGRPAWIASLRQTLEEEQASIDTALISHWHHDHTGGIRDLLQLSPHTQIHKHNPEASQLPITHGQKFEADGVTLTASHTPGHTTDHMVFVFAEENAMFTADNVLGQGTAVFEDMSTYMHSLKKMQTLFGGRAYPGHGPVVENGPGKIIEYINHRQQREKQVLQIMRTRDKESADRSWASMEIVKLAYHDVPEELHRAACNGVLQILDKLEREERVFRQGTDSWRLTDKSTL